MISAILDTNIFVRAAIGFRQSAASGVLDAYYDGRFRLVLSPGTMDELLDVLTIPYIRARHGWSDDNILRFLLTLLANAAIYRDRRRVSASTTRDLSDAKFLALAEESRANFLVTKDRRHLLHLGMHQQTRFVTPAQFLKELPPRRGTP
jgi:putative PIN family toxin of toxin-antitoxin system